MTCRYYTKCPHKHPESRACKDIDTNPDEFTCGTYRQFNVNDVGFFKRIFNKL